MTFAELWNYPLIQLSGQAVTVGNILLAVFLLALGFFVSKLLSQVLAQTLGRRLHVDPGARDAIRTLSFYLIFVSFAFTSLNLVQFPLTIFTIAGGAVAIGVGFGSQNLMNNFISGLILHLERPIRIGDLVSVEGTHGIVEAIGARSTRIRTTGNTQMIVPNSFFLQNSLVNYTLSDDVVRTHISVGVVYGSPTREVEHLILVALEEHERVLKDHPRRILFTDFGDNALVFEALFWLHARTIFERREVESDLRFRIDELFREAGLVIAFPQRDVHLDTVRPLEVKLVREEPTSA